MPDISFGDVHIDNLYVTISDCCEDAQPEPDEEDSDESDQPEPPDKKKPYGLKNLPKDKKKV